jgi:hypothetical protein
MKRSSQLKRAVLILMLLLPAAMAGAQTTLTLPEALARALQVNNTIDRSRVDVNVAEENRKQLLSSILPQVNLTGSTIRNTTQVSFGRGADTTGRPLPRCRTSACRRGACARGRWRPRAGHRPRPGRCR